MKYYMAPEQADGRPDDVGPHTDVYSLGVILFETLTGQTPFRTDDDAETMRRVREETAADPSSLREGIPRDLAAICLKCLEKAPARRYAHAGLLAADLDLWLRNERPVGIPGPVTRTTRRLWQHRILVACVAFFVVIATAGAAALYIRDPDKPLREIQASLAADRRVTLIGDTGKPKWFRWQSGEAGGKATTGKGGVFTVHSGDLGLIELLPSVGVESYQFSVEVRHKQSNLPGCVGLYFARNSVGEGQSETQFFTQLSYNDVRGPKDIPLILGPNGPVRRPVQNQVSLHPHALLKNGEREVSWETPGAAGPKFDPEGENKAEWRVLTVNVSPSRVDATWEGQPIPADMTELMAWATKEIDRDRPLMPNHPGAQALRPAFTPSGSLGLYILRGSADFRRATVTLKEPGF